MRRHETGSLVAALGAGLLVVSLFLRWYEPDLTAWDAFEVWDLVLAGLGLSVLATAAAELGWWRGPVPKVEILFAGGCAVVIVAAAILSHPPAAIGRGVKDGVWLGMAGAVLMAAGGVMARFGISLALSVEPRAEGPVRARRPAAGGGAGRVPGVGAPVPGGDPPPASAARGRRPAAGAPPAPAAGRPRPDAGAPVPRPVRIPGPAPSPAPAPSPRRAPQAEPPPSRAGRAAGGDELPPRPRGGRGVPAEEPAAGGRRWLPRRRAAPAWENETDDTGPRPDPTGATRVLPDRPDPPPPRR